MLVHPQKLKTRLFLPFGSWLALTVSLLASRQFPTLIPLSSLDDIVRVTMSLKPALVVAVVGLCSTVVCGATQSATSDGLVVQTAPGLVIPSAMPTVSTMQPHTEEVQALRTQRRTRSLCPGSERTYVNINKDDQTDEGWVCLDAGSAGRSLNLRFGEVEHASEVHRENNQQGYSRVAARDDDHMFVSTVMAISPTPTVLSQRGRGQMFENYYPASIHPLPDSVSSRLATVNPPGPTPESKARVLPYDQELVPLPIHILGYPISAQPTTLTTRVRTRTK